MTNGDLVRSLTNEQIAAFLAHERWNLGKVVFETVGFGITDEFIFMNLLKWVNEECEVTHGEGIHSTTQKDNKKPKV